jgi:signal transduction histidine kinase
MGLGLSVSSGIVREHEGEIIINSKPGRGTLFKVMLPLAGKV